MVTNSPGRKVSSGAKTVRRIEKKAPTVSRLLPARLTGGRKRFIFVGMQGKAEGWTQKGKQILAGLLMFLAAASTASTQTEQREWRTWTSQDGSRIEAYLKEVQEDRVVIVRRDGQEFTVPLARFSEADRAYVAEQQRARLPSLRNFRATDFTTVDLPDEHQIDGVPHVRVRSREPAEAGAVQMILDFHGIEYEEDLVERLAAMVDRRGEPMPAANVRTALANLPLDIEIIRRPAGQRRDRQQWAADLNAIQTALSWDLPVILSRDQEWAETILVSVAVGYSRRDVSVLDPTGSRSTLRIDARDLQDSLTYALIVFPRTPPVTTETPTPEVPPAAETPRLPPREFLSQVSTAIREAPQLEPEALATHFGERGLQASVRDVNRQELLGSMGQTRTFARSTGPSFIESSLDAGHVVVIPQEHTREETGVMLVYGKSNGNFMAVDFRPDRTFQREEFAPSSLAGRWLTREDRTYHLYLIEIRVR